MNYACPLPNPSTAPPPASLDGSRAARRRRFAWIGTAASVLLFAVSLVVLWTIASEVDAAELRSAFTNATWRQIGLGVIFTAASYLLLTGYDALALWQLKLPVPYRTTALASFASYAVSFTLGFPLVTAGTVRYWIYAPKGLSTGKVASLTVIAGLTFWLGLSAVLGWSLITESGEVARLTYVTLKVAQGAGVAAVGIVLFYLAWVSFRRRAVTIQGWRLELPGFRVSLGQMLIGAGDVCAGAAVLFVLLPEGAIRYETFLAVYVVAVMLGIASHAPGGLGVFEATVLIALSHVPREPVLGALLLFRIVYYLCPFVLALALLGAYEISGRLRATRRAMQPEKGEAAS
jgi:uncharacterized membrane protein YbhN (UPF0104 family)